ncbi:MAG: hypothetical protein BWY52_00073 [Chloroflexi bacterium ADurb.Bin325]|nr:MAG: hypothetical protein BWY52_00073 [Chloroflexi bacterium ADurb.Bin325]
MLAAILFILSVSIASAQGAALTIGQGSLRLWPEFDDPGLLVIFAGDFAQAGSFPRTVTFPIAAGARKIQATYRDASGTLLVREYTVADGKLTYEVPVPTFHYEYYVDRPDTGAQREIDFRFEPGYATDVLEIVVQQPARATDFSMTPAAQSVSRGTDGLTYHTLVLNNVAAETSVNLQIHYTKTDSGLSSPQLAVTEGAGNVVSGAPASASARGWLPYVLIGVGVTALVAALVYWLLTQRRTAQASRVVKSSLAGGKRASGGQPRPAAANCPGRSLLHAVRACLAAHRPFLPPVRRSATPIKDL